MVDDQIDIEVAGEVLARLMRRGQRYVLFSLDSRLREIDEKVFPRDDPRGGASDTG